MNASVIIANPEVKRMSSDELKKKVLNYRKDNEYLEKMTNNNAERQLLIQQGTSFLINSN
jgi:hypothetical protein